MIIDKLQNAKFYYGLGENFQKAFEFLKNTDLKSLENGKHLLDGENLYVSIDDYDTKPENLGKFEAHRKYVDIQYIISGSEKLGYTDIENCTPVTDYDEEKDIVFLENNEENRFAYANEGDFLIFAPQDAHMPCISQEKPSHVKKAVVKIKIS